MLLSQILAQTGQSEKVLIWTLVLSAVGGFLTTLFTLIKGQLDRVQDRKDKIEAAAALAAAREQDRLDAESKARIILQEGAARELRIRKDIADNTKVSIQAFDAANGHNEKIAAAIETAAKATETIADATKVIAEKKAESVT